MTEEGSLAGAWFQVPAEQAIILWNDGNEPAALIQAVLSPAPQAVLSPAAGWATRGRMPRPEAIRCRDPLRSAVPEQWSPGSTCPGCPVRPDADGG